MRDTSPEITSKSLRYGLWALAALVVLLAAYLSTCLDHKPANKPAETRSSPSCPLESVGA